MELGIIMPSYNRLLGVGKADIARRNLVKTRKEQEKAKLKTKDAHTAIANQNNERVGVDVSA